MPSHLPPLQTLTWASATVDGYLHRLQQARPPPAGPKPPSACTSSKQRLLRCLLPTLPPAQPSPPACPSARPLPRLTPRQKLPCSSLPRPAARADAVPSPLPLPYFPLPQGLSRADELMRQVADLAGNRLRANLDAVAAAPLLDLPPGRCFAVDEFVAHQVGAGCGVLGSAWGQVGAPKTKQGLAGSCASSTSWLVKCWPHRKQKTCSCSIAHTHPHTHIHHPTPPPPHPKPQTEFLQRQAATLAVRCAEAQRACDELLDLVGRWPRENVDIMPPADAANQFRQFCAQSLYQASVVCGGRGRGSSCSKRERRLSAGAPR